MDDKLVAQNPRDSLIVMRKENLDFEKARKAEAAKDSYLDTLKTFSGQFLRSDVFNDLSKLQKNELDKLCASFCRRRSFFNSLPFLGSFGGVIYLSFLDPLFLLLMLPWIIGSFFTLLGMETYCEKKKKILFFDQIDFLLKRNKIKKAGKLEDMF